MFCMQTQQHKYDQKTHVLYLHKVFYQPVQDAAETLLIIKRQFTASAYTSEMNYYRLFSLPQ